MGDQDLPGVLVAGLEGSYGICEDHVGDLQKHFNLITMQEFLENKMQFGPKIQAVYIWGGKPAVDQELLGSLPSLKIIASAGVGLDHLDLKLIASFGVKVANTPQAVSNPTADMGMALLLAAARRVVEGHMLASAPDTEEFSTNWMGQEVTGATLGIIGMGSIGYKVAQRARAFEMKILYRNRRRRKLEEEEAVGATYCESLDELLQWSDFVLLAVGLTPQTQRLIGKRELSLMKPTAILINIGRGLLVDQEALVEALQTGVIKGAALDVTHPEPLPRKKFWYEGPSLGSHLIYKPSQLEFLTKSTSKKTRRDDHVRLRALNGLLYKALTDLLCTPEVSQEICDLNVQLSKVSLTPDFSACRVYWKTTVSAEQNAHTEAVLRRSAAHMSVSYNCTVCTVSLQASLDVPADPEECATNCVHSGQRKCSSG